MILYIIIIFRISGRNTADDGNNGILKNTTISMPLVIKSVCFGNYLKCHWLIEELN